MGYLEEKKQTDLHASAGTGGERPVQLVQEEGISRVPFTVRLNMSTGRKIYKIFFLI